jgi:transcriptional regulator with XRE-family HTH domain
VAIYNAIRNDYNIRKEVIKMKTRLKELRIAKGLKQEDVAKVLGIGRTAYGAYEIEDNAPPLNKLLVLAEYYNVSIDYILYNEKTSPEADEVIMLYQGLSHQKQAQVQDFIRFLKESE